MEAGGRLSKMGETMHRNTSIFYVGRQWELSQQFMPSANGKDQLTEH